jgi:glycosyltransferase involved in cell wall biosynthesis
LPVIARDLPVFREVMGEQAHYFSATKPTELASALRNWLTAPGSHRAHPVAPWLSWEHSARKLADLITLPNHSG